MVRLDDLAARPEIPRKVGFLKIDTEGHDLAVLEVRRAGVRGAQRRVLVRAPLPGQEPVAGARDDPPARCPGLRFVPVLCHQADTTVVFGSTFEGVQPTAWGNLLFFHNRRRELYQQLRERLATAVPLVVSGCGGTAACMPAGPVLSRPEGPGGLPGRQG